MLGKLIKHEWKNVYRVGGVMSLTVIAVTAIGCMMLQLPAMTEVFSDSANMDDTKTLLWFLMSFMSFMIYMFMLMGATYGLFIFLGIRFYKTMYTDQGYLTNTLPVTGHQLLTSKILVAGIWYLVLEVVVVVSVVALLFAMFSGIFTDMLAEEGYTMWEFWKRLFAEMGPLYEEMGLDWVRYGIVMLIMVIISPFTSMTIMFGSITLGQLSKKHKALMGILAYLGITFLNMIITSVVQVISTVNYSMDLMATPYGEVSLNMNSTYETSLIFTIAVAIILYFVSHFILTKKLNMD